MVKWMSVLFVLLIGSFQTKAQTPCSDKQIKLSGGFKAEANLSNFILSGVPETQSKLNIGGMFGFFAKSDLSEHLTEQEEVLVYYLTSNVESGGQTGGYQYWGIEVPFYGIGQWKTKNGGLFYCGTGPYVEYGLSAKYRTGGADFDLYLNDIKTNSGSIAKLTMGAAVIVGYEFVSGIQLNVGYKIGINNALDAAQNSILIYPSTFSFGFAYRFI